VAIGLLSAAVVVALPALGTIGIPLASSWFVVAASMLAATLGAVVYR
jgi:hypothetical protein